MFPSTNSALLGSATTYGTKNQICRALLNECAQMSKKPHYLIQCYDVYLDTAQTPVMKRTDFVEIVPRYVP